MYYRFSLLSGTLCVLTVSASRSRRNHGASISLGWAKTRNYLRRRYAKCITSAPGRQRAGTYAALDAAWVAILPLLPFGVEHPARQSCQQTFRRRGTALAIAVRYLIPVSFCCWMNWRQHGRSRRATRHAGVKAASKRQTTLMVTHQLEGRRLGRYLGYARWRDCRTRRYAGTQRRQRRFCG